MTQPKHYPPFGLHIPCDVRRVIDGDTVVIGFGSDREWKVRLLDCWCPFERGHERYIEAKQTAFEFVDAADSISVFIPISGNAKDVLNEVVTMGRLLGYVYLREDQTLNHLMVTAGMASTRKGGELGT